MALFRVEFFREKRRLEVVEMKYSKALQRLEEIINKIESEEIDVDDLSARVKEAVELIRICKKKIEKAEMEVKEVVDKFEEETISDRETEK